MLGPPVDEFGPCKGNLRPPKSYFESTGSSLRHPKVELRLLEGNLMATNINIGPTKSILGLTKRVLGPPEGDFGPPKGSFGRTKGSFGPSEGHSEPFKGNFGPLLCEKLGLNRAI